MYAKFCFSRICFVDKEKKCFCIEFSPFDIDIRKNSSEIEHSEGGNVVVQSKLGFYDLRNKSPIPLWRSVSEPPSDPPVFSLLATGWLQMLKLLKLIKEGNFQDTERFGQL